MTRRRPAHAGHSQDVEVLRAEIVRRYRDLSPRLQQVARYVLDNPGDVALHTLAVIAERCQAHPSTIVRFAKIFGYEGASDMQKLFKDELLTHAPSVRYAERIRQFNSRAGVCAAVAPQDLLQEFVDKRAYLLDGVAGMLAEQRTMLTQSDLLIAVSFDPYALETVDIVSTAKEQNAKIIAITDSRLSPIASPADVMFDIRDAEVRQFRSLTTSLSLAQTLAISYAVEIERRGRGDLLLQR